MSLIILMKMITNEHQDGFFMLVTSSHVQIDPSLVRKRVNIFVLHCAFFRDELMVERLLALSDGFLS